MGRQSAGLKKSLFLFQLLLAASLFAQQGPPGKSSEDRISGIIRNVSVAENKQDATVTIESGAGHIRHDVIFTAATVITSKGKSSSLAEVKQGRKLDCIGTLRNERFEARSCKVR
jgi:hypothetical protein